jgi:raffinose/stachyose/melibiose transport system substrate-binding protein
MHMKLSVRNTLSALVTVLLLTGFAVAQTNLTFWSWRTEDADAYAEFIAEFHEQNPDINVTFTPYHNTEYNTILSTALQGGGGPDIVHLRAYGGIEPLAEAGLIVRLDDKVAALADFDPEILLGATNRSDGGIYGVPFAVQVIPVLYNRGLFSELGLEVPTTWDEFVEVSTALQAAGVNALANGAKEPWTLETLFGGVGPAYYGGSAFFDDVTSGETDFNDPRFSAALEQILALRPFLAENYLGIDYTDMQTIFAFEQAGMLVGGSYELANLEALNPELELGSFPFPGIDGPGPVSVYVDGSYGINAASKNQDAALRFIEFLASREYGQMFTDRLKQLSAVPGVEPTDPELARIVQLMETNSTPYLFLTAFRFGQPSGSTLLQNELQAAVAGDKTVQEAVDNIQRGIATWYEGFPE